MKERLESFISYLDSLSFLQGVITILGWVWIGTLFGLWYNHGWTVVVCAILWLMLRKYEEHRFGVTRG